MRSTVRVLVLCAGCGLVAGCADKHELKRAKDDADNARREATATQAEAVRAQAGWAAAQADAVRWKTEADALASQPKPDVQKALAADAAARKYQAVVGVNAKGKGAVYVCDVATGTTKEYVIPTGVPVSPDGISQLRNPPAPTVGSKYQIAAGGVPTNGGQSESGVSSEN